MDVFNNGGRFHETEEPLCLIIGLTDLLKLEFSI